jgi:hypothetical protein
VDAKPQFRSLAEPWADTGTSTGRLMIAVFGRIGGRGARSNPHPHRRGPQPGAEARAANGPSAEIDGGAAGGGPTATGGGCYVCQTRAQLPRRQEHDFATVTTRPPHPALSRTDRAMTVDREALEKFFAINRARFDRCLEPQMSCQKKAIRAHSIQNAKTLDLLEKSGHLIAIRTRFSKSGPQIDFGRGLLPRRQALVGAVARERR